MIPLHLRPRVDQQAAISPSFGICRSRQILFLEPVQELPYVVCSYPYVVEPDWEVLVLGKKARLVSKTIHGREQIDVS